MLLQKCRTLAPHYREAGSLADPRRAVEVMAEAGWRALSVRATDEAIKYLAAAADQAAPENSPMLLDGLGRAYMNMGELDKATAAWTRGVTVAEQFSQEEALTTLRFRLAMLESERQDSELANDRLWAELQIVNTDSADVWIQRFIYTLRHGGPDEARKVSASMAGAISAEHPADKADQFRVGRHVVQRVAGEGELRLKVLRVVEDERVPLRRRRQLLRRRHVAQHVLPRRRQLVGREKALDDDEPVPDQPVSVLPCDAHGGMMGGTRLRFKDVAASFRSGERRRRLH